MKLIKTPSILFLALFAALAPSCKKVEEAPSVPTAQVEKAPPALTAHAEEEPSAPASNHWPAFSWDRVPLYMHIRKAKNFTQDEIKYLATFPLVTFEKTTGSETYQSTEDGTLAAAKAVKEINPSSKVLYYRNVFVHYGTYKANAEIDNIPGAFLVGRNGRNNLIRRISEAYDLSNPQVREWWVGNAKQLCADPLIDGVFLDGIIKVLSEGYLKRDIGEGKKAAVLDGYKTMMTETRQAIGPDKIMLANVLRVGVPDSGLEAIKQFDGSYIENFEGSGDKEAKQKYLATGIEAFQRAAREGYMIAFTAGLSELNTEEGDLNPEKTDEIRKGLGENDDYSKRLTYLLSLFLVCAEKHSYFLAHDGYHAFKKNKVWMKRPAEFDRPLGPPKGPAVQDGYIYTREFAHAKVRVDIENEVGEIEWLEPGKN
ncbi:MAG: putative glycoside hydrolase [Spartobacteria bacterium]